MFKYCLLISLTLFSFSKTLLAQKYQFQKATYEIIEDSILVEKGKTIWQIEPPVYEIIVEKKLITPFQYIQLKGTKSACVPLYYNHSKFLELTKIPATYKNCKTKILKIPARIEMIKEPDIYRKFARQIILPISKTN